MIGRLQIFIWRELSFVTAEAREPILVQWSYTESGSNAWNRNLNSNEARVNRSTSSKAGGFSVRCVKD